MCLLLLQLHLPYLLGVGGLGAGLDGLKEAGFRVWEVTCAGCLSRSTRTCGVMRVAARLRGPDLEDSEYPEDRALTPTPDKAEQADIPCAISFVVTSSFISLGCACGNKLILSRRVLD